MTDQPTIIFAGGGTGGHLTPGLAVAEEMLARSPAARLLFVGSDRPLERELIAKYGYEHLALPVESTQTLLRNPPLFLWGNWRAYRAAAKLLTDRLPQAVIGLGGFASVPVVLAATRRKIPTLLLEQNTIPGRATQWLSSRVDGVCISFAETTARLPRKVRTVLTGNPVRGGIARLADSSTPMNADLGSGDAITLLILGGSQGAKGLNDAVRILVEQQSEKLRAWRIRHQTGPQQADELRQDYTRFKIEAVVAPFFDDMSREYQQATVVVSRAGATTLAELACAGCPAVLVPYPHAAADHQTVNAQAFVSAGAAEMVSQSSEPRETASRLANVLLPLMSDSARRAKMRTAMHALARPDAARQVVELLQSLIVPPKR